MDGAGFPGYTTVDPMMLVIDTGVNNNVQPCYCGQTSCDYCYTASPLTPDVILASSANSPLGGQMPFGHGYVPQAGYHSSTPATLSPTALHVPHSTSRSTTPAIAQPLFGNPFASGYGGSATAYRLPAYGALPTPESTQPSNNDGLGGSNTTFCKDFLGKNGPRVQLEYDVDSRLPVFELVRCIDEQGFRAHTTNEAGEKSAIYSLQRSLSFNLTHRTPPIEGQLRINLQIAVQQTASERHLDRVTPQDLRRVLNVYELQTGEQFQLGVIVYDSTNMTYNVSIERPSSGMSPKTIWLFYDETGSDTGLPNQWSAILPENPTRPSSYAAAARSAVLPVRSAPAQTDPRYLAPPFFPTPPRGATPVGHSRPHSPHAVRHRRTISRGSNQGHGPIPAHHPRNSPRASAEPGNGYTCPNCNRGFPTNSDLFHHMRKYDNADRPHRCWCGKAFRYPKDLKRHQTSHSNAKNWRCDKCEKAFTRKDNLQRHAKDEHDAARQ